MAADGSRERGWLSLDHLRQDVRLTLQAVAKQPAYAATVVLTLALGIAATATISGCLRGILLRPLPFVEAERLVMIRPAASDYRDLVGTGVGLYAADFPDLQHRVSAFDAMPAYTSDVTTLRDPERSNVL